MVSYRAVGWSSLLRKWSLVLLLVILHLLLHFLSWEREGQREGERGVKNVRFLFVEEESAKRFRRQASLLRREGGKRKTSTENKMSTPRYTRPRERTFAAIFGFILVVVVVVIEFLSHSRGVGQSFDTDEIFFRVWRSLLHFVGTRKKHIWRRKKRLRFEENWSRRERGNARTGSEKGVARTSPGDAIICAAFFGGGGGGGSRVRLERFCAFLCCCVCVNVFNTKIM